VMFCNALALLVTILQKSAVDMVNVILPINACAMTIGSALIKMLQQVGKRFFGLQRCLHSSGYMCMLWWFFGCYGISRGCIQCILCCYFMHLLAKLYEPLYNNQAMATSDHHSTTLATPSSEMQWWKSFVLPVNYLGNALLNMLTVIYYITTIAHRYVIVIFAIVYALQQLLTNLLDPAYFCKMSTPPPMMVPCCGLLLG